MVNLCVKLVGSVEFNIERALSIVGAAEIQQIEGHRLFRLIRNGSAQHENGIIQRGVPDAPSVC